jgi:hypothetical protein
MAIMLDADLIVRGEKGAIDLRTWLSAQATKTFEIAAITVAELWHGVPSGPPERNALSGRNIFKLSLLGCPSFLTQKETACEPARIWAELEAAKKRIGYYDLSWPPRRWNAVVKSPRSTSVTLVGLPD